MSNPQFKMKLISAAIVAVFSTGGAMAQMNSATGYSVNVPGGANGSWVPIPASLTGSNLTVGDGTVTASTFQTDTVGQRQ